MNQMLKNRLHGASHGAFAIIGYSMQAVDVGPNSPDEKDRVSVDELHPRYAFLDNHDHPLLTALLDICGRGCCCTRRMVTSI